MSTITQTTVTKAKTKTTKAKAVTPKTEAKKEVAAKVETKEAGKAHTFTLIAGTTALITHKGLTKAIAYHVGLGNLERCNEGIRLTAQGSAKFYADRVAGDPATFQRIARFVRGKGETPSEYKGQPTTNIGDNLTFPNMLYWGSFTTGMMRKCFAAIWSSPQ